MRATVLIPTYADRGPCLRYTVDSILRQTVQDLEVFIMGDGVAETSREIIHELCAADPRVRFFDHPKHARRGEPYRDEALMQHARGEIVCYLTDHDLYLPHHVEVLYVALREADFAHTLVAGVADDEKMVFEPLSAFGLEPACVAEHAEYRDLLPLAFGAHRLDFYRALPQERRWHQTPADWVTDGYFYHNLMTAPGVRMATVHEFTVVYLANALSQRRKQPGYYAQETAHWHARLVKPGFPEWFHQFTMERLVEFWSMRRRSGRRLTKHLETVIEDRETRLRRATREMEEAQAKAAHFRAVNIELRAEVEKLRAESAKLRNRAEKYQARYEDIKGKSKK